MQLESSVALVTGANRGLGRQFAAELVRRGAKVYAAARRPETIDLPGVVRVPLDITDPESVARAAKIAEDATVVINNAGSSLGANLLDGDLDEIRKEMETHYFGTLAVTRAFAPVLERNGGGAVLNVLSVLSWVSTPDHSGYCAAKSAEWSMTNAVRLQLAGRGIVVTALHVGLMDTDMGAIFDAPKSDPAVVAALAVDAVAAGDYELLADDTSRAVRAGFAGGVESLYPQLAK